MGWEYVWHFCSKAKGFCEVFPSERMSFLSERETPSKKSPSWMKKGQQRLATGLEILTEQLPTLPRRCHRSTIGLEGLNYCVRNGNRCFPFSMVTRKLYNNEQLHSVLTKIKSGQADRQISIFKLKLLLALHLRPINLVVSKVPVSR